MSEEIKRLGRSVKDGQMTWQEAVTTFNLEHKTKLTPEAFRSRYRNLNDDYTSNAKEEYETSYGDGTIEAQKIIEYNKEIFGNKDKLLDYLGYNHNEWEFTYVTTSTWQQHTKEQTTKQLYAVKFKVKPKLCKEISLEDSIKIAKEVFKENIKPFNFKKQPKIEGLDKDKLMELPGIELHLGKMAWSGDTGQDYDKNIAQDRFYNILEEIIKKQDIEQCDTCLMCIGNDFFNSDTVNATTTKGTPQTNDLRWKKMFNLGLKMYVEMINSLIDKFNHLEIRLCSGNHDKMASFYLYMALSCYYRNNDKITFVDNYKDVQCFLWGKCGIFFTHGDSNLKRLIKSIPAEFYKEWGKTIFRELHLGHLHKEVVVDDDSGMITRRIGSPTGTDQYHYEERFVGATQKYQTFTWHKQYGLLDIQYINFENQSKKKLIKKKTHK